MATSKKPAAEGADKTFVAFFTTPAMVEKGIPKVEIFKEMNEKPRAPLFSGRIDGKQVGFFLRKGPKGAFLGLVGDKLKDGSNNSEDLGAANVGTRESGIPVLVIDYKKADGTKQTIFASISKKVDQEMLASLGMNVEKQAEKRASAAAKAAVEPAATKKVALKA